MSITSKVRQTVVLTGDGNLQSLVMDNTAVPTSATATNIKKNVRRHHAMIKTKVC